jgi:hypothetical protein
MVRRNDDLSLKEFSRVLPSPAPAFARESVGKPLHFSSMTVL